MAHQQSKAGKVFPLVQGLVKVSKTTGSVIIGDGEGDVNTGPGVLVVTCVPPNDAILTYDDKNIRGILLEGHKIHILTCFRIAAQLSWLQSESSINDTYRNQLHYLIQVELLMFYIYTKIHDYRNNCIVRPR